MPATKSQTWEGFVLINPDPEAGPFEGFLGSLMMEHYRRYGFERRYIQANGLEVIRTN